MTGSAYGARTAGAGATARTIARTEARSAVTAGGRASLTQYTTAHPNIAASVWAAGLRPGNGQASTAAKTNGPAARPTRRRRCGLGASVILPRVVVENADGADEDVA